jgi:hypothetical protein
MLNGSGWNSHTLGTLNSGIAALGRRNLEDALGVYGGFSGLAEALSAVNDGEFQAAADELENEGVIDENGECGPGWHLEEGPDGAICVPDDPTWDSENPASRENKEIVAPDIHGTFSRLIAGITDWAGITGKSVNQRPTRGGDAWFVPNYAAVRQASIDTACSDCTGSLQTTDGAPYVVAPYSFAEGGAFQIMAHADVLDIPNLHLPFDREELNEQYRDLHKEDNKSTSTGGAAVLKQQIDYTAIAERAYRLRHATPIRCTLHHSIRREAHGHEVGVFQRVLMWVQDNLKASTPPSANTSPVPPVPPPTPNPNDPVAIAIQLALAAVAAGNNAQAAALLAHLFTDSVIQLAIAAAAEGGLGVDRARDMLLEAENFNDF